MLSENCNITLRIRLVLLFFSCIWQINAQNSYFLSLDDLFSLGIENSLKVKSSQINMDIAADREKSAIITQFPDVNIGAVGGVIGQPIVFRDGLSDPAYPPTPDWSQNYNVELTQPIYRGGKIKYGIEKASLEKQIAALNIDRDKADVKLLLIGKYLDLFRFYKQKEVLKQNIEDAERRLHDIKQMKKEGMITENDVIRSELQLTNFQLALRETNDNIEIVSQQLDVALGLKEDLILTPDTTVLESIHPLLQYENYVQQAYDQYPDLKIIHSGIELARKNMTISKADYLPSLSLRASNVLQRPIMSTSPIQDLYMNTWNVSLVLSYKLSSLYQNKHNVSAAKRGIDLQMNQEEQQKQNIRTSVKAAYIKHQEAIDRIEALNISVRQANENYRIVQNRYFNQLAVMTDLLDASTVRLDAELQLTSAKANVIYTYYQLLRSSGNL